MILAKFFKKNLLQLQTKLQFDICYVIKTRVGFKIAEITRFKTILAAIQWLFKIVINLIILENSQEYVYSEVIC